MGKTRTEGNLADVINVVSGNVVVPALATGNTAPSTTGTTKTLIVDSNGLFSFITSSGAGISRIISSISTTTTGAAAANTDYVYLCTGTFTYTQPTAVGNTNRYTIKNVSSGTITVAFTSAQTGDGSTTLTLRPNVAVDLISDNANWFVI